MQDSRGVIFRILVVWAFFAIAEPRLFASSFLQGPLPEPRDQSGESLAEVARRVQSSSDERKPVKIAPLPARASVWADLIGWEVSRAWVLAGGTNAAGDIAVPIPAQPATLAPKLVAKRSRLTIPPVAEDAPISLRQLSQILRAGIQFTPAEGKRLLGALRLWNERTIYVKSGKPVDPARLARALVNAELGALPASSANRVMALPDGVSDILKREADRLAGGRSVQMPPFTPSEIQKILKNPGFNPASLRSDQWADFLGGARLRDAMKNPLFAASGKRDARRDWAAGSGGGMFPLDDHSGEALPLASAPDERPRIISDGAIANPFASRPKATVVIPGGATHQTGNAGAGERPRARASQITEHRFQLPAQSAAGSTGQGEASVNDAVEGLNGPELDHLKHFARPQGFALEMHTTFSSQDPGMVSLCQFTVNRKYEHDNKCYYGGTTATHCFKDKEAGADRPSHLTSVWLEKLGTITIEKNERQISVHGRAKADFSVMTFSQPGLCRDDVPVLDLARDSIGDRTPIVAEGRNPLVGVASPIADNSAEADHLFQVTIHPDENQGQVLLPGDSGGPLYRLLANGHAEQIGVISAGVTQELPDGRVGYTGVAFGAGQDSILFANNILDTLGRHVTDAHRQGTGMRSLASGAVHGDAGL